MQKKKLNDVVTYDNLIKWTPGFFVFYGFIYLNTFLNYFDLQVSNVYDLAEIFLAFLPIVDVLLPAIALYLIVVGALFFFNNVQGRALVFSFNPRWAHVLVDKTMLQYYARRSKRKHPRWWATYRLMFNTTVFYVAIFILINNSVKSSSELDIIAVIVRSIIFIFLSAELIRFVNRHGPSKFKVPSKFALLIVCLLVFFGFSKNLAEYSAFYSSKTRREISFSYENQGVNPSPDTTIGDLRAI